MGRGLLAAWLDVPRLRSEAPGMTAYMRQRSRSAGESLQAASWVTVTEVSPYALCAIVGAEDPLFFQHHGIWWRQMAFQIYAARRSRRPIRAVSTITQQLARNLYLSEARSLKRKLLETLLAIRLEHVLEKRRILELYINVVEWGRDTWGIGEAARRYFGATACALNPFQAVLLASLLPAPRAPLVGRNLVRALNSQRATLHYLYGAGLMDLGAWRETEIRVGRFAAAVQAGRAPDMVLREIGSPAYPQANEPTTTLSAADLLESACGLRLRIAYTELLQGGMDRRDLFARLPERWTGTLRERP